MSNTPLQDLPLQGESTASVQTLVSRTLPQPTSDPSASRRVSFYKSGDTQFGGHRMVINARTFKTFDALLDALSKKVPLPFGVRTITTPRGTHLVKTLEDLHDGGSYVCSDQKRVKPLNLDIVNRRQVPWNTTRPVSVGRRRQRLVPTMPLGRRNEGVNRPARMAESRVAVRTPKRLVVFKNRDSKTWRTIMLQRRTAPTFDALLDYLSQVMQFRVVKLYTQEGSRVDGLPALILCSGVIVASGNEAFRPGNYDPQRPSNMGESNNSDTVEESRLQPLTQKKKVSSDGTRSRNFSLSSEKYFVNQINKSLNGSSSGHQAHQSESTVADTDHHRGGSVDMEACAEAEDRRQTFIVPREDDIEKSFRVNEDGSMTVEMKVRLTIKGEEMIHWTTTLSRSNLSDRQRTMCDSGSRSGSNSPDSNNAPAKDSTGKNDDESKEENRPIRTERGVAFSGDDDCIATALEKTKSSLKRTPTPGHRSTRKKASVESIKMVTENGIEESTLGSYSYMERTDNGEMTEGYCMIRQNTSSGGRPVPKPRKTGSAGARYNGSQSSLRSSGMAEILQVQNNGMEITETVMHIYETQGCYDNYFANSQCGNEGGPENGSSPMPRSKAGSTDSGPRSSSNDCDVDFTRQSTSSDSQHRGREEILSLSSEPMSPTHQIGNNLSSFTDNKGCQLEDSQTDSPPKETECLGLGVEESSGKVEKKKKTAKSKGKLKSPTSTTSSDKKQKDSAAGSSKSTKLISSPDKSSSSGKKSGTATESENSLKSQKTEKVKKKQKVSGDETTTTKKQSLALNIDNTKGSSKKQLNLNQKVPRDSLLNVNTPDGGGGRPAMKKNMLNILPPKHLGLGKKMTKQKSMNEKRTTSPKLNLELSESVSMPALPSAPTQAHQYVENWLQQISTEPVPYIEEVASDKPEPATKVIFQIGGDSESEVKSEEGQGQTGDDCLLQEESVHKSMSCLSVPVSYEAQTSDSLNTQTAQKKGLCISMPSVRMDPKEQESRLKMHKSAAAIVVESESTTSSNYLSPKATITPVLRQLCSSFQSLRRTSMPENPTNLEKSRSMPDFSSQVASVFGAPSKALLSFLSVMTLRESLKGSEAGDSYGDNSRSDSEALLVMQSLQKISAIHDEEQLKASLSDLQSRTSSQLKQSWRDFQEQNDMLENQPPSPKFSEQEFALDVASEVGDFPHEQHLAMEELMEELDVPQELREELSSLVGNGQKMYPQYETDVSCVESQCAEKKRRLSDSEEDLEVFGEKHDKAAELETGDESTHLAQSVAQEDGRMEESCIEPERDNDGHNDNEHLVEREADESTEIEPTSEHNEESHEGAVVEHGMTESSVTERDDCRSATAGRQETLSRKSGSDQVKSDAEAGSLAESIHNNPGEEDTENQAKQSEDDNDVCNSVTKSVSGDEEDKEIEETQELEEDKKGEGDEGHEDRGEGEEEEEEQEQALEDEDLVGETDEVEDREQLQEEEEEAEEMDQVEQKGDEKKVESDWDESGRRNVEEREEEEEEMDQEEENGDQEEVESDRDDSARRNVEEREEEAEEIDQEEEKGDEKEVESDRDDSVRRNVEEREEDSEEMVQEEENGDQEEVESDRDESGRRNLEEREEEEEEMVQEEENGDQEEVESDRDDSVRRNVEEREEEAEEIDQEEEKEDPEEVENDLVDSVNRNVEEEEEEAEEIEEDKERDEKGSIEEEGQGDDEREDNEEDEGMEQKGAGSEVEEREEICDEEEEREEEEVDEEGKEKNEREKNEEQVDEEMSGEESELEQRSEDEKREDEGETQDEKEDECEDEEERVDEKEEDREDKAEDEEGCRCSVESDSENAVKVSTTTKVLEEACYIEEEDSIVEADAETGTSENGDVISGSNNSSLETRGLEVDEPCQAQGMDTANEHKTDEGVEEEEAEEERNHSTLPHPVEISQELLDFVNSALMSSSLTFTYDSKGNLKIEPDSARVVPTTEMFIPKIREDSSYRKKRLPSPNTSDLSDYRPETSESYGYKTQASTDLSTESGEEDSCINRKHTVHTCNGSVNAELTPPEVFPGSETEVLQHLRLKSGGSFSSYNSEAKASAEDLSYYSAGSSSKPVSKPVQGKTPQTEVDFSDGVLIDQGRWLLKENHLIRKSPPVSLGMYDNLDNTSVDTAQDNTSEDIPHHKHYANQHAILAELSSSELEELAKPTPNCTYFNMPHGSDSDPFQDDLSLTSKRADSRIKRDIRVSPTVDTTKTWAKKNGSQSSFASVEFKMADSKVHPEGGHLTVEQPSRSQNIVRRALQSQDSLESLQVKCGQYCPIL